MPAPPPQQRDRMSKAPSMTALARQAGVSISTISRVINRPDQVADATVEHVLEIMQDLGVDPESVRRTASRTRQVAQTPVTLVSAPARSSRLHSTVTMHLLTHARRRGMRLSIDEPGPTGTAATQAEPPRGIITYHPPEHYRTPDLPLVNVLPSNHRLTVGDSVLCDHFATGRMAYARLRQLGCRKPVFLSSLQRPVLLERWEGFSAAAADDGIAVEAMFASAKAAREATRNPDSHVAEDELALTLKQAPSQPDGIFIPTDQMTVKLYLALLKLGVSLGEDIRLISVDNDVELLRLMPRRPDTIDLQPELIAEQAIELLHQRIMAPEQALRRTVFVEPRLVPRAA